MCTPITEQASSHIFLIFAKLANLTSIPKDRDFVLSEIEEDEKMSEIKPAYFSSNCNMYDVIKPLYLINHTILNGAILQK